MSSRKLAELNAFEQDVINVQTQPSPGALSERRDALPRDGSLVYMKDEQERVIAVRRSDEHHVTWCLHPDVKRDNLCGTSLQPEALFYIQRQGNQFSIQSLGAEGRYVLAEQSFKSPHRLSRSFSEHAMWEICGDQVINAYFRHKDLGYTMELVTALPTSELAEAEREQHKCVKELQTRIRRLERDGNDGGWSTDSTQPSESDREVDELKNQLETVKRQLDEAKEATESALKQRDEHHRRDIERMVEERARLDSALQCIRGMTLDVRQSQEAPSRAADDEDEIIEEEEEYPAIGIPVESAATPSERDEELSLTKNPLFRISLPEDADTTSNPPPSSSRRSSMSRVSFAQHMPAYRRDTTLQRSISSDSNYDTPRRTEIGGGCYMVEYNGHRHPEMIDEDSLDRILDKPVSASSDDLGDRPLVFTPHNFTGMLTPDTGEKLNYSGPFPTPVSIAASASADVYGIHPRQWLDSEDSYQSFEAAPTQTVTAINMGSPQTANLLSQYMAEPISHSKAFTPKSKIARPGSLSKSRDSMGSQGSSGRKRSSFLLRQLVSDNDIYG